MRILIHDYPGYAFPVELARELARRGHHVLHVHFSAAVGPKGTMLRLEGDPETLEFAAIGIRGKYRKYSLVHRFIQERAYAGKLADAARRFRPDVVISNAQPDVQAKLLSACREMGVPCIHWLQDIYSAAIGNILSRKNRLLGRLAGTWFRRIEARNMAECAAVVCISPAFVEEMKRWGVPEDRLFLIENWATLAAIPMLPQDNPWSREHGLAGRDVVLYAGTLGWKHNPALIEKLALELAARPKVRVVVASEGLGAGWLKEKQAAGGLENLVLLPFQPEEKFAQVLASAKVLLAILESDASAWSAPSKILSYFCAGRPVVASFPPENHSARLLSETKAGIVCAPDDDDAFIAAVCTLLDTPETAAAMSLAGRNHAESHFRIGGIADAFERLFEHV